jgi:hypothetical protein
MLKYFSLSESYEASIVFEAGCYIGGIHYFKINPSGIGRMRSEVGHYYVYHPYPTEGESYYWMVDCVLTRDNQFAPDLKELASWLAAALIRENLCTPPMRVRPFKAVELIWTDIGNVILED